MAIPVADAMSNSIEQLVLLVCQSMSFIGSDEAAKPKQPHKQNKKKGNKMEITKTESNILVTGIVLNKIEQIPAQSFQTFKKLNKHTWGLDGLSKSAIDKVVGQINVIYARRKKQLRDTTGEKAIKLIKNAALYNDIKLEEKLDAKGKKHATIQLKEKPMRMTKAGEAAMVSINKSESEKREKQAAARIAELEAQLAAFNAPAPSTKETKAPVMLPEFA